MTAQRKEYKKELTLLRRVKRTLERRIEVRNQTNVRNCDAYERKAVALEKRFTTAYKKAARKLTREMEEHIRRANSETRMLGKEHNATQRRIAILEGRLSS